MLARSSASRGASGHPSPTPRLSLTTTRWRCRPRSTPSSSSWGRDTSSRRPIWRRHSNVPCRLPFHLSPSCIFEEREGTRRKREGLLPGCICVCVCGVFFFYLDILKCISCVMLKWSITLVSLSSLPRHRR